jgi:hypothetical protein
MTVADHKKRFTRMMAITVVCAVVALAAALGAIKAEMPALWALFGLALAAGFAAQIQFVVAFAKAAKGEQTQS